MKKISSIILLVSFFVSSPASAGVGYTDGNKILSACNELSELLNYRFELDSFEAGRCWGYIAASTDIFKVMKYGSSRIVCIPEEKEVSDYVRIVLDYLNEHPKDLEHPAFQLITKAFAEIFPCPQTQLQLQSPQ
jgi:hypothetical protein